MNKLLEQTRAKLKLTLLATGREITNISVDKIPDVWEDFGTKGDKWISIKIPESENSSGCIYLGKKDSVFDPHTHKDSVEHITVLNEGGEAEVITDKWVKTLKYPNSLVIDKNVPHAVIFKEDTKFMVLWHPKFENGWDADFINE